MVNNCLNDDKVASQLALPGIHHSNNFHTLSEMRNYYSNGLIWKWRLENIQKLLLWKLK